MNQSFMKTRPVLSLVLSMSLPMVISMMVSALYNIVDSYYVAKISEEAMTALSLVFPVQNLINAVTIGFSVGANAVIAYHLGAQDKKRADTAASWSLICNGMHGLLLTIVCIGVIPWFLSLFTTQTVVIDLGVRYARIAFGFSIFIAISMAMEKIFQASGKMMITMVCMLSGCIINIVLDPILIFGWGPFPKMGIEGAAWATGIGQTIGVLIYLICYKTGNFPVHIGIPKKGEGRILVKKMYAVGIPATLNLALPSLLISCLNTILSVFSSVYILVLGVYYKLQTFLYLPVNGIVQGMRPIIGYNFGAQEMRRVHAIYRTALLLSSGIMVFGTVLCWRIPEKLIGLFSSNPDTIQAGITALRIISIGFVISSLSVISCGSLEGLGKGGPSLVISILRYVVLILPIAYILSLFLGAEGVWHAFWITEVITAGISFWIYQHALKKV